MNEKELIDYDFSGMSDIDLVLMQKQVRDSGQDKEFLNAILKELGERQHTRNEKDDH
jgi:hypothetical protein